MGRWCVAQTQSQREAWAQENLLNQNFGVFLPFLREHKGKEVVLRTMFPGYIFIEVDEDTQAWKSINGTRGIYKVILSTIERPSFLPRGWLDGLMSLGGIVDSFEEVLKFSPGQVIEFVEGPFKGQRGVCRWSSGQRIALLMNILGNETVVQTRPESVRYVSSNRLDLQ